MNHVREGGCTAQYFGGALYSQPLFLIRQRGIRRKRIGFTRSKKVDDVEKLHNRPHNHNSAVRSVQHLSRNTEPTLQACG